MNTYKPGDVVRRTSNHGLAFAGDDETGRTYVVDHVLRNGITLVGGTSAGCEGTWNPGYFKLITPAAAAQTTDILEAEAIPDEAYDFGKVDGYDEAKREDEDGWWDIDPTGLLEQGDIAAAAGFGLEVRVQARRKPAGA